MFLNFSKNLYENLIQSDFKTINQDYDKILLTNETPFLAVEKYFGPNLFIVLIHNSCKHTIDYNLSIASQLSRQVHSGSMVLKFKQAIILNIFVTNNDKSKECVKDVALRTSSDNTGFVYNVYWNVNIDSENKTCDIVIQENQPKKILNVYKLVEQCSKKAFKQESSTYIKDITMNSIIKSRLNLKSQGTGMTLILASTIFLVYLLLLGNFERYSILPETISNKEYYRFLSAIFANPSFFSMIISIVWINVFAGRVERHFGKIQMVLIFFLSAVVSNVFAMFSIESFYNQVYYGVYGGIFGLASALLVLAIKEKKNIDGLNIQNILLVIGIFLLFDGKNAIITNISAITTGFLLGISYITNKK